MAQYQVLRVGVDPAAAHYVHHLNNHRLFIGPGPGEHRREFRIRTVGIVDHDAYRDALRKARCHFLIRVETSARQVCVDISRITYFSNGSGRAWKLYQGRGGRLGIKYACAQLAGRRPPPPYQVAGRIKDLMHGMGMAGQDRWLANHRHAR